MRVIRIIFAFLPFLTVGQAKGQAVPGETPPRDPSNYSKEVTSTSGHENVSGAIAEAIRDGTDMVEFSNYASPETERILRILKLQDLNLSRGRFWLGLPHVPPFRAFTLTNWCRPAANPVGNQTQSWRYDPKVPGNHQRIPRRDWPDMPPGSGVPGTR